MLSARAASPKITHTINKSQFLLLTRQSSTNMTLNKVPTKDRESFVEHLHKSYRILALCGAGLSASSGLPTFRGAGGIWRNHDGKVRNVGMIFHVQRLISCSATSLATPEAFEDDPALVWQFYSYRRHMALNAQPNPAHFALAKLARKRSEFITITQNVDGEYLFTIASLLPSMLTCNLRAQSKGGPSYIAIALVAWITLRYSLHLLLLRLYRKE